MAINNNIIALTMGIQQQKECMNLVAAFQIRQHSNSLLLQLLALCLGLVVHAPSIEEVDPVDVGRELVYVVVDNHG